MPSALGEPQGELKPRVDSAERTRLDCADAFGERGLVQRQNLTQSSEQNLPMRPIGSLDGRVECY